jgi:hypothetical protein
MTNRRHISGTAQSKGPSQWERLRLAPSGTAGLLRRALSPHEVR